MRERPLIELRHIHQSFRLSSGQKIKVLKDISLALGEGEVLALLGPSGSGKSTCLRILSGLIEPTLGDVRRRGAPLVGPNPDVALVFQNFALLPWLRVAENVAIGLEPQHLPEAELQERVKHAIDLVGLEGFEEAYPRELSGGMKQRVGIARALVMERPVLCLDEPFSALDVLTAETLRREVLNLWSSGKTGIRSVIIVTHNILEAVSMGSRIVVMGAHPGHIRLSVQNELPYPRDEKSGTFRSLVENIHDVITESVNPDTPDWTPPALAAGAIESIPPVNLNECLGLLEHIGGIGGRADAFALAHALSKDSVQVLLMAKTLELLDLVDTPRNAIVLTELGRRFIQGDVNARKALIHDQLSQLQLVRRFRERLSQAPEQSLSREECLEMIQEWLPNEAAHTVLDSLIQWGRYGEVLGFNADEQRVYVDTGA
jgi:NitT/TauT family transport system ATP-binding protein